MAKTKSLIIKNVRCLYPALDAPKAFEGQTEEQAKYGIKILIPKSDKVAVAAIKEFVNGSITDHAKWPATVKKQVQKIAFDADPYVDNAILKDGDALNTRREDEGKEKLSAYAGHYVIGAKRNRKIGPPTVVNAAAQNIPAGLIAGEIQSGYWINIQLSAYCYDKPKQGITLSLNAVQLVKTDEVFGAESPFSALEETEFVDDAAAESIF